MQAKQQSQARPKKSHARLTQSPSTEGSGTAPATGWPATPPRTSARDPTMPSPRRSADSVERGEKVELLRGFYKGFAGRSGAAGS